MTHDDEETVSKADSRSRNGAKLDLSNRDNETGVDYLLISDPLPKQESPRIVCCMFLIPSSVNHQIMALMAIGEASFKCTEWTHKL